MTVSESGKAAVLSSVTTAVADEIVIRGRQIPVKICQLANTRLKFFPEIREFSRSSAPERNYPPRKRYKSDCSGWSMSKF